MYLHDWSIFMVYTVNVGKYTGLVPWMRHGFCKPNPPQLRLAWSRDTSGRKGPGPSKQTEQQKNDLGEVVHDQLDGSAR